MEDPNNIALDEALDAQAHSTSMAEECAEQLVADIESTLGHGPATRCSAFVRVRDTAPEGSVFSSADNSRCTITFPDQSKLTFWEGMGSSDYVVKVIPAPEKELDGLDR